MSQVFQDLSHALTRTVRAQSADINDGDLLAYGTAEDQVVKCSAANSNFTGIAGDAARTGRVLTCVEKNAYKPVIASKAIAIGKRLYLTSTGQKVTDVKPVAAGTYISPGVSKSVASADGEKITMLVDPQEIIVV